MLTLLPTHIEVDAWQALRQGRRLLFACALVAVLRGAAVDRMDVVAIAGIAAAGTVVLQMVDRPGPSEIVSLKWGRVAAPC